MLTQPIHYFAFNCIHPNPWQTRDALDQVKVQERANDFLQRGMLQIPIARPKPGTLVLDDIPTEIELAFGHTRFAAWQIAFPENLFPVELRNLSDREMSEYAISENGQRSDLSAIEKAKALKRHIESFKVTQKEAAALMGLEDASSVSNLLRLLKLPDSVQQLSQSGELPEQYARRLVSLAQVGPKDVEPLAKKVASADEDKRQTVFDAEFEGVLRKRAKELDNWSTPFKGEWSPKKYYTVANHDKGEPDDIPACEKCPFQLKHRGRTYCMRPACFARKTREWAWSETHVASKKLGIAVADAENSQIVWDGKDYDVMRALEKLIPTKPTYLRLVPTIFESYENGQYNRERILGTKFAVVACTDMETWGKAVKIEGATPVKHADPAKQKEIERKEREKREREDRWTEHMCKQRDVVLYELASAWANALPSNARFMHMLAKSLECYMSADNSLEERFQFVMEGKVADGDVARMTVMEVLLVSELDPLTCFGMSNRGAPDEFRKRVAKLADELTFKLPKNWDAPLDVPVPVEKDDRHCWHCGKSTPSGKPLGNKDIEAGWSEYSKGEQLLDVTCPDCSKSKAVSTDTSKANGKVDKEIVSWLTHTPSDDINFTSNLKKANIATLRATLPLVNNTVGGRKAVEVRIRKLEKEQTK